MESSVNTQVIASTVCISSAAILASFWLWKKSQPVSTPKKWVKVGNVNKLVIYPIKSCKGVEIKQAIVTRLGLKFTDSNIQDRNFQVVDENLKEVVMTNNPRMSLIWVEVEGTDGLVLNAPDMPTLKFACPKPNEKNKIICSVEHDLHSIKALDCGDEVAAWFQSYLGKPQLRLVYYYLNKTQRTLHPFQKKCPQFAVSDMVAPTLVTNSQGSFHNATSYLLVAQESIDELNKRLVKKATWKNFRPTIFIDGISEPFADSDWSYVKVGQKDNVVFNVSAPCDRCLLTTVDQDEGVRTGDADPLKKLREMKLNETLADKVLGKHLKNKGLMGLRIGLHSASTEGTVINVGDSVYTALL